MHTRVHRAVKATHHLRHLSVVLTELAARPIGAGRKRRRRHCQRDYGG
jgi:hypothetical protein